MDKNLVFIEKAKKVHGDVYDYSNIKYINNVTGLNIICREHGMFTQRPTDHLAGSGCKLCGRKRSEDAKRSDKNSFVLKAKKIHGDKYNYDKVNYISATTNIEIICPVHGSFLQLPHNHLNGLGCRKCSIENSRTNLLEFKTKASKTHNNKYDYSKSIYVNNKTPLVITCPLHGDFEQRPSSHNRGEGCPECAGIKLKTNEEFIKDAIKLHNGIYNYSKVKYINNRTDVIISCSEHGEFNQTPNSHLRGSGCPECYNIKRLSQNKFTTDEFIEKAKKVHSDKYDYSKVNYDGGKNKIIIICKKHGNFLQSAGNHLGGSNCPSCARENFSISTMTNKEDFITRANKVHDKDYSYTKLPDKVKLSDKYDIYCKKCGEYFSQRLSGHLSGKGHLECSKVYLTNEEYIEKCNKIHNNKYDYSLVNYVGTKYKVLITCPIHGTFMQNAGAHLRGVGCFHCGRTKAIDNTRTPINDYIRKAREVHGEKFDYSLVKFQSVNDVVEIICPVHGVIKQRASGHLKHGCVRCHFDSKFLTNEEFIEKSKKHHNETYDYSKTIYNGHRNKVIVICKEHGEFEQLAGEHIRGTGCPICSSSKGERKIASMLQKLNIDFVKEFSFNNETYRYDFKLKNNSILIEYDGEQHFKSVPLWGGDAQFIKQKNSDRYKDTLAILQDCVLIRIPYLNFENLEVSLINKISISYPYFYSGKFYTSLKELNKNILQSKNCEEDYDKYLTKKLIDKL